MRRLTSCAVLLVGFLAAGCAGGSGPAASASSEFTGFFDTFRRGLNVDYRAFDSLQDMVDISDVVLVGEIESVRRGRTIGGSQGDRGAIETVLLWTEVIEVVRGDLHPSSRRIVEIEVFQPEFGSVEQLDAAHPEEPMLFILQDTARQPQPAEVDDSGADHVEGKPIYTLPTTKAAFIERGDGLVTPFDLVRGPYDDSVRAVTLEELAQEIRRMP